MNEKWRPIGSYSLLLKLIFFLFLLINCVGLLLELLRQPLLKYDIEESLYVREFHFKIFEIANNYFSLFGTYFEEEQFRDLMEANSKEVLNLKGQNYFMRGVLS